jgi:hypothetical protein
LNDTLTLRTALWYKLVINTISIDICGLLL